MRNQRFQRQVAIKCGIEYAKDFISNPYNLPKWTFFFKKKVTSKNKSVFFETPIGRCETFIQVWHSRCGIFLRIVSRFRQDCESALMHIYTETKGFIYVRFFISLPYNLPNIRRNVMLEKLQHELIGLKNLLEQKALAS